MAVVNVKALLYTEPNIEQAINPKEEAEILNSLFLGSEVYEHRKMIRDMKLAKLVDML